MRRLRWLVWGLLAFAAVVVAVDVVSAHNCSSPADCEETPNYNTTIAVGGGAVAVTTAILTSTMGTGTETVVGEGTDEEETEEDVDPCLDLQTDFEAARSEVMQHNRLLEMMRDLRQAQEQQYHDFKESTYWSNGIGVAFLGGGLVSNWLAPVARRAGGWLGRLGAERMAETVGKRLAEAFAKTMGQQLMQQTMAAMNKQGIKWKDIAEKPVTALKDAGIKEVMLENMKAEHAEDLLARGVKLDSPVFKAAMKGFDSTTAKAAGDLFSNGLGFFSTLKDMAALGSDIEKLEVLRHHIHMLGKDMLQEERKLWRAQDRLEELKYDLENCRHRVSLGLDP